MDDVLEYSAVIKSCLVTGGTGFIGRHLVQRLVQPKVAGRNPEKIRQQLGDVQPVGWNLHAALDPGELEGVETVFHLAGESVFHGRWTEARKTEIMDSRRLGTRNLVAALARLDPRPRVLICASAIGYYGGRGDEPQTESSPPGTDFLARVCQAWEEEAQQAVPLGMRVVSVRIGVVLGKDGGALPQMLRPFRLGVGGKIGSGHQYMSWIHIEDLVNILLHVAVDEKIRGPVNATAPGAVTNTEFTAVLGSVLHRPTLFTVPAAVLRITMGEFADVLLASQRVVPARISEAGYRFRHPELAGALRDLLA